MDAVHAGLDQHHVEIAEVVAVEQVELEHRFDAGHGGRIAVRQHPRAERPVRAVGCRLGVRGALPRLPARLLFQLLQEGIVPALPFAVALAPVLPGTFSRVPFIGPSLGLLLGLLRGLFRGFVR